MVSESDLETLLDIIGGHHLLAGGCVLQKNLRIAPFEQFMSKKSVPGGVPETKEKTTFGNRFFWKGNTYSS